MDYVVDIYELSDEELLARKESFNAVASPNALDGIMIELILMELMFRGIPA